MLVEELEAFDKMAKQTIVSWKTIIDGYIKLGFHDKVLRCLEQMQLQGILIDDVTFLCGLRACANTNAFYDGLAIHAQIVEEGFDGHTLVCDTFYICMQELEFNELILQKQYLVDIVLIVGHVEHSVHDEALQGFKGTFIELLVRGSNAWTSLISGYAEHDYQQEMYYFELHEIVYILSMVMVNNFKICKQRVYPQVQPPCLQHEVLKHP